MIGSKTHLSSEKSPGCSGHIWDDTIHLYLDLLDMVAFFHQKFQVPKIEVLNLIRLFWGWVFPYITLTYSLYR